MVSSGLENFRKDILSAAHTLGIDIAEQTPDFKMYYVLFRRDQSQIEIDKILSHIEDHPAFDAAKELLVKKPISLENASFPGIVSGVEKSMFGFKTHFSFLGFVTVNIDSYQNMEECLMDLYHFTAQALDTYQTIEPKTLNTSDAGIILQPKRNLMVLCQENLKSDIFSALMMHNKGIPTPVQQLARMRGKRSLIAQNFYRPEDYPFVIATDVVDFSIENFFKSSTRSLKSILHLAEKIAASFDKFNLKIWMTFVGHAQTMALTGFTEEQILGTAIYTSQDPFIKATGNVVAEITNIRPEPPATISNTANPFADDATNKANHIRMVGEIFEHALMHAIEAESSLPLERMANNQNEALLKGRVLGWCANAMQSTARTFDMTLKKGSAPGPISRIEFQRVASQTDWESLNDLNNYVMSQRRQGQLMGYNEINDWAKTRFEFRPIMESVRLTLSNPEYAKRFNYVDETDKSTFALPSASTPSKITPNMTPNNIPKTSLDFKGMPQSNSSLQSSSPNSMQFDDDEKSRR